MRLVGVAHQEGVEDKPAFPRRRCNGCAHAAVVVVESNGVCLNRRRFRSPPLARCCCIIVLDSCRR